ncbi:hypothetical protein UB33_13195 [Photobacterium angustum]|uniref:DUF3466 family protein n=1 Tax=Photobacterium angustum TaxID=661 RepID=UPI0005E81B8F|nr:DUF3466 family protein [Photobacterium angustum]KJG05450.1 hypothetical protein UB33_13195 [Photobacterium angustum]PSV95273.1 DUF3466 domain-containing protein [Photobacterium angustum]
MPHKMLKLSTLAILVAGASQASAAVYDIVPVDKGNEEISKTVTDLDYFPEAEANAKDTPVEVFTTGIKSSAEGENCFTGNNCNADSYDVAGTVRRGTQGTPLSDTTAYNENRQFIDDLNELYSYCKNTFGYANDICSDWADNEYYGYGYNVDSPQDGQGLGGLQHIQQTWLNGYYSNALALKNGMAVTTKADKASGYTSIDKTLGDIEPNTTDAVLEGIVGNYSFGTSTSAVFKNGSVNPRAFAKRGFVNNDGTPVSLLAPVSGDAFVKNMGQTTANGAVETTDGNLLVVGSSSFAPSFINNPGSREPNTGDINLDGVGFNSDVLKACADNSSNLYSTFECQFSTFANEAAFWVVDNTGNLVKSGVISSNLAAVDPDRDDVSAQASANAVAMVNDKPVAVGYASADTDDSYVMQAAYFEPNADLTKWTQTFVPGLTITTGDDRNYQYTMANDINSSFKVVGIAKSHKAENRSIPQKMFIFDKATNQTKFLDSSVSSLFFSGSNGDATAINDNDQVVGWVDSETKNQIDGSERRHRAFTYIAGSTAQGPLKAGSVWMLDDLTNDGGAANTVANSYRIISATDINAAGVISATANYCAGGYQNLTKQAQCLDKNGNQKAEKQVAIKLVPKANATDKDIIVRKAEDEEPVKRSGGSLGILALTALGFIGFRRRK